MGNQLGTNWLNTEGERWAGHRRQELQQQGEQLNVVVFQHRGLTMLAAPWEYAFCCKINRWLENSNKTRPYELTDAAHYLQQWIRNNGSQPVPIKTVEGWAKSWKMTMERQRLLSEFNTEYRRVFKRDGVVP